MDEITIEIPMDELVIMIESCKVHARRIRIVSLCIDLELRNESYDISHLKKLERLIEKYKKILLTKNRS